MGRDNTGKKQEQQQLDYNQDLQKKQIAKEDTAVGQYNTDVGSLRTNPGYAPDDLKAMRSEAADQTSATYGGAADTLKRNAAQTGYANDAGLYPQLESLTNDRGRAQALGQNNISAQQAGAVLDTRRALPSMSFQPASLYGGQGTATGGQSGTLINQRQQVDQTTPLWAQFAQSAMAGASQVGAAAAGKPGCWIAEALYGEDDARTHLLRSWLNDEFMTTWFGRLVMKYYLRYGERLAAKVRRSWYLRMLFRPFFELALFFAERDRHIPVVA